MPQIECYGMQGLCAIRFTRLKDCLPTGGPTGASVYHGIVDLTITPQYVETEAKVVMDSCDNECLKLNPCPKPGTDRWDIEATLCGKADIEGLYELVYGWNMKVDVDGNTIGFAMPPKDAPCSDGVMMDMWVNTVSPKGAACGGESGGRKWWRIITGRTYLRPGELTFNADISTFAVTGYAEPNPALANQPPGGPYDDWPWDPAVWDAGEVGVMVLSPTDPPSPRCGYLPEGYAADTAVAGSPGTWTASGGGTPAYPPTITQLTSGGVPVTASPTTAWTVGQYVQTETAGAGGQAYWNGTAWTVGQSALMSEDEGESSPTEGTDAPTRR